MVIGWSLLLGPTAFAGDPLRALATVRIRARPSTAADTVRFAPMGSALDPVGRLGGWVQLADGWVHHSLVGEAWVPPPDDRSPSTARGVLVGWTPTTLFELLDERPLRLCARPLDGRSAPPCIRADPPRALHDASVLERAVDFWDRDGRAIQAMLRGANPVDGPAARPDAWLTFTWAHVVTPDGADRLLASASHDGVVIWTAPDFTRTSVTARHLGTHVLFEFASAQLGGAGTVDAVRLVDLGG